MFRRLVSVTFAEDQVIVQYQGRDRELTRRRVYPRGSREAETFRRWAVVGSRHTNVYDDRVEVFAGTIARPVRTYRVMEDGSARPDDSIDTLLIVDRLLAELDPSDCTISDIELVGGRLLVGCDKRDTGGHETHWIENDPETARKVWAVATSDNFRLVARGQGTYLEPRRLIACPICAANFRKF